MRLAIHQTTTYRWTLAEDLHHYRRAGYRGVGLWLRKLEDFGVERSVELLEDAGMAVSSLSWVGGFTGADALSAEENLDRASRTIELAGQLQAGCVLVQPGSRNRHTRRHANRLLHNALEELLPHAATAGVPLVLEPMHPACADSWTFLTDLEATAQIVANYDTRWLRLAYDAYHTPFGAQAEQLLEAYAPLLGLVQIGDYSLPHTIDAERCRLGTGRAPLGRLVATLQRLNYDGFVEVELLGATIEPSDYGEIVDQSAKTLSTLMQRPPVGGRPAATADLATGGL